MKIGFIMINYNDFNHIEEMLNQIKDYSIIDQIIIVDNASTDNSLEKMKRWKNDKIVILASKKNGGYGSGINIGVQYLNEKYPKSYAFISNTDIIIHSEEDLKRMIDAMDENTSVIGPVIEEHNGYNCGWKVPNPWQDILLSIPIFYKKYKKKMTYQISNLTNELMTVEAVSGSFFLINCLDLKQAGYFDENVFLYYEENILSKKIQKLNKKIKILTTVKVFHNHSVTIDRVHSSVQKYRNLKKSQFYFQTKYNHAGIVNRCIMKILFKIVELGLIVRYKMEA